MDLHRSFDPNRARRQLRARLLDVAFARGNLPHVVPHSFDTDELFAHTRQAIRSKDRAITPHRLDLLADAGSAMGLSGDGDEGLRLLRRGVKECTNDRDRARFHYLIGHHHHQRRGEWDAAEGELARAVELIPAASAIRAHAHLALIDVWQNLGRFERATRAAEAALSTGIKELEPHGRGRLASVYSKQGYYAEAIKENREARRLFQKFRNEIGVLDADGTLAGIYMKQGLPEKALPIIRRVRRKHYELLDVMKLGMSCDTEGLALEGLGDLDGARERFLEALRYWAEVHRPVKAAMTLQNLAGVHDLTGEPEMALALLARSVDAAVEAGCDAQEFNALGTTLQVIAKHRIHLDHVPRILGRCHEILAKSASFISKTRLAGFARLTSDLARAGAKMPGERVKAPAALPRPAREAVESLLAKHAAPRTSSLLEGRLGEGLSVRRAPRADLLRQFLLGWTGWWFGNSDYRTEFSLPPETSKYQLRLLRDDGIIRQIGNRKATRYQLGFHL